MFKSYLLQGRNLRATILAILVSAASLPVIVNSSTEPLISTLAGLDLARVYVHIDTESNLHSEMKERVEKRFLEAGLQIHTREQYQKGAPLLIITLRVTPLTDIAAGKYLYARKIELFEDVKLERPTPLKVWAATWSHGVPEPFQIERVKLDDFRADLDSLIHAFVHDYKYANRQKGAEGKEKSPQGEKGN